jgi:hypothetical protein
MPYSVVYGGSIHPTQFPRLEIADRIAAGHVVDGRAHIAHVIRGLGTPKEEIVSSFVSKPTTED